MYLNLAETQQDAATLWTEQAYHRLRRIKTAVDPDDLIRSNYPSRPHHRGRATPPVAVCSWSSAAKYTANRWASSPRCPWLVGVKLARPEGW